nr:PIN domain-containing protein [Corallococcus sp. CA053C]
MLVEAAPTIRTRNYVTRVYVDTNIFMDFYQSANDRLGVFEELRGRADKLITTEQTIAEFERNRAQRLSSLIDTFGKSIKIQPHTTSVIKALEEWPLLIKKRDEFQNHAASIQSRLASFLADPSADPVYTKFLDLVKTEGVQTISTTDVLITRAHRRKLLGNPPSSPDKHTIGDELIWESLMEGCGEDLIIVSRDGTFTAHEAFLRDEYAKRTGKKLLGVVKTLALALELIGAGSELIEEEEYELPGIEDDDFESSWDTDARQSLEAAYEGVEFDFEKHEMYVAGDSDNDFGMRTICSLDEFNEWASEQAFSGYNSSAPRDSGEWAVEFDDWKWIENAQLYFEEELQKLGWT